MNTNHRGLLYGSMAYNHVVYGLWRRASMCVCVHKAVGRDAILVKTASIAVYTRSRLRMQRSVQKLCVLLE